MSSLLGLAGLLPLAAAVLHLVMLWRGLAGVRRLLAWRPVPVAKLVPGGVEASGSLHAIEGAVPAFDGAPCVHRVVRYRAVATRVTSGGGKTTYEDISTWIGEPMVSFARAELRDGSGRCAVDLEKVTLVGDPEERVQEHGVDEFFAEHPELRQQAPLETKRIDVHEAFLRDGAPVLLQGVAARLDEAPESAEAYRTAAGRLGIGAGEGSLDLLPGRRGWLLAGAIVPTLGALGIALWLAATAAGVLYVEWALR